MTNRNYIFFLLVFLVSGLCQTAWAQDLPTEQVEVIKSFDARLLDAERVGLSPRLPDIDTSTRRQFYDITSRSMNVEYLPPKIRPLAMRGDALQESYNGYTKLGAGFPRTFYIDGSYNIVTEETFNVGVDLLHHNASNSGEIENQRFSYTKAQADATYYFDQGFAVNGNLGYTVDNVFFYGYNELNELRDSDLSFDKADVKQSFSTFEASANIFNGERTIADFNYEAGVDFYFMEDNFAARETGFNLNLKGTKWFRDAHPLTVELITDFTSYRDTSKQKLNNFFLKPSYTYHHPVFTAKIGANVASSDDEFSFFPDVELSARVADNIITAFVGAEGSLKKNNLRNLSDYNPYVSSRIDVQNTRYYHYYGGIKGNFQGIDYRAQAGYKTVDDLALFQYDGDTIPRFDVLYDTATIVSFKASIVAPLFEGLEVTGTFTQNFYNLDREEKAWHLPATTLNVGAAYTFLEKSLTLKGEFYLENGVPVRNAVTETTETLNTLFDVSVGADYRVTDKLGVFLQVNNLANNKRQRWNLYPTFGINFLGGIVAKF